MQVKELPKENKKIQNLMKQAVLQQRQSDLEVIYKVLAVLDCKLQQEKVTTLKSQILTIQRNQVAQLIEDIKVSKLMYN